MAPGVRDGHNKPFYDARTGRANKWHGGAVPIYNGWAHDKMDGESAQWAAGTVIGIGRGGTSRAPPWAVTAMVGAMVAMTTI